MIVKVQVKRLNASFEHLHTTELNPEQLYKSIQDMKKDPAFSYTWSMTDEKRPYLLVTLDELIWDLHHPKESIL
jgi:DNA-binding PadR family transcriptional regulator